MNVDCVELQGEENLNIIPEDSDRSNIDWNGYPICVVTKRNENVTFVLSKSLKSTKQGEERSKNPSREFNWVRTSRPLTRPFLIPCSYSPPVQKCGSLFASEEKKKEMEFEIAMYQYHINCNSEESLKHLKKSLDDLALGLIITCAAVIAVIRCEWLSGSLLIYNVKERVTSSVEEFKEACRIRKITKNHKFLYYIMLKNLHFLDKTQII